MLTEIISLEALTSGSGYSDRYVIHPRIESIEDDRLFTKLLNPGQWDPHGAARLSVSEIDRLIKHSLLENKLIEIHEYSDRLITKFYRNWYPLVIIKECNFCPTNEFERRSRLYFESVTDLRWAQDWYNNIVDEYQKIGQQGFSFYDVSSNNILVNEDFTDFRLIDVASIGKYRLWKYDPIRILMNGKFVEPTPAGWQDRPWRLDKVLLSYTVNWQEVHNVVKQIEARVI